MIVYLCAIKGHDFFTSTSNPVLDEEGGCWVFEAKMSTEKSKDYSENCGANASQEEQEEGTEETSVSALDFIIHNRLEEYTVISDKKTFLGWAKSYMKLLKSYYEEKDEAKDDFGAAATAFCKKVVASVKDCSFYASSDSAADDPRNMVVVHWNDDGMSAKCYAFKYGFSATKY